MLALDGRFRINPIRIPKGRRSISLRKWRPGPRSGPGKGPESGPKTGSPLGSPGARKRNEFTVFRRSGTILMCDHLSHVTECCRVTFGRDSAKPNEFIVFRALPSRMGARWERTKVPPSCPHPAPCEDGRAQNTVNSLCFRRMHPGMGHPLVTLGCAKGAPCQDASCPNTANSLRFCACALSTRG